MKKLYQFLILGLSVLTLIVSCTDNFEEINTNPNEPDRISDPSLLLAKIIQDFGNENWDNSFDRGAIIADQISNFFVGSFGNFTRAEVGRFGWDFYGTLKDLDFMIAAAEGQGLNNYVGVGLVLRAWMFQNLTDNFGPIPYSEAGKAREDINFPKYDSQEAIYAGILAELERANNLLGSTTEPVEADLLYNGDIQNWRKFANGLRLRILLRQSDRKDPSSEMQKIVGNPSAYPLFTSHEDQAALQYDDVEPNTHPAYNGNVSDWASSSSTRLSATIDTVLTDLNDPRITVFALPTSATMDTTNPDYVGTPNGVSDLSGFNGGPTHQSLMGLMFAPKQYNEDLVSPNAAQSVFMPYSEVQFILAEARERGFISVGDAQTYYLNGIRDQFEYYSSRIPATWTLPTAAQLIPPASYYSQDAVAYTGTREEKLEKIYTQKWLSLFLVGFEAWSEWRRVGIPRIEAGPQSTGSIPVRHPYPADEQNTNTENYQEGLQLLGGGDEITTRVWWDVADN